MQTIQETIENLRKSLIDYIEATYHISARSLVAQRKELLDHDGVIYRIPYLESTPKYLLGDRFASMTGLPTAASDLFVRLSSSEGELPKLIHDPPYKHQADSLRHHLIDGKNLIVTTGTGSGKTEAFLLPILGKFAKEAEAHPRVFANHPAVRVLIMYPMNALVNDQLGRLRALFGDPRLVEMFNDWCGRPPRFARYTSRTPYAGIRTSNKDSRKLQAFDNFYIDVLQRTESEDSEEKKQAKQLLYALKEKGKWPAKPDLPAWFGARGSRWQDRTTGEFIRAVTLPNDSELLTRHEVQSLPPDLLVTNYSMLEYMLMRPIERSIFDLTKDWLAKNPEESFLIVLDEAHLYRGAAGAEIGLLIRRLRDRLGIPEERFRVICATASFNDVAHAPEFCAQLSGIPSDTFVSIKGDLDLREDADIGTRKDAEVLSGIDLSAFYEAESDKARIAVVKPLLDYRGVVEDKAWERALFEALCSFKPMGKLINATMKEAKPITELGSFLFSKELPSQMSDQAVTTLMALGSIARPDQNLPGLLPCRIHNFFRGLPGLWVCMDPNCSELVNEELRDGICGKMYSQPMNECNCGARVLELFTCRNCGTAYARAYTDKVNVPQYLWAEPGEQLRTASGDTTSLLALDLLLEQPACADKAEPADYDLQTGQLNPIIIGKRTRTVYIRQDRISDTANDDNENNLDFESRGQFKPCAVCAKTARSGRSYIQDHQTKGDQPFQAIVARQIQIQSPDLQKEATPFAPLRGRKILTFSDSRQVAARLAPNLQMYSERDSLRPLIISGFRWLQKQNILTNYLNLNDLYFGVLLASKRCNVRLRPEIDKDENFNAPELVENAIRNGNLDDPAELFSLLIDLREHKPPRSLLSSMLTTLTDRFWGMEPLALATLKERDKHKEIIINLPSIPNVAETDEAKLALARFWLRCWTGFQLTHVPGEWIDRPPSDGYRVKSRPSKQKFKAIDNFVILDKPSRKIFWDTWAPKLLHCFTQSKEDGDRYLNGNELSLQFEGDWVHCRSCKSVHRSIPSIERCLDCNSDSVKLLDPDNDPVYLARKGFYRKPVLEALLEPPRPLMALVAAEHTGQLNAPQNEDVFSKAEENELLFQDIKLHNSDTGKSLTAIDVLSSTTTMEVGIDIGALSGVALRNMPPGRANYQQRAGRAGRRGNAVATVVAFGSSDSHDEHYFSKPDEMIRGSIVDPKLTLDNIEIARRHIRAFLLQNYHQDRLPVIDPDQPHDLFSVLGSVASFRRPDSLLNLDDFATWLNENEDNLRERINAWIPQELSEGNRAELVNEFATDCLEAVHNAIVPKSDKEEEVASDGKDGKDNGEGVEDEKEQFQQVSNPDKLLNRLLYRGKLPRYAFPTDVATFHVFDRSRSSRFRHIMKFAPSQGLPIALSQYAPDKQVWISGKCYTSGAIYSIMKNDRSQAWDARRLYMECRSCGFAKTFSSDKATPKETRDCDACGGEKTFGPAQYWMRPPGFAHPIGEKEVTSPDEIPESSYATRAKLTMDIPTDDKRWKKLSAHIRALQIRQHLLVSNAGPRHEGYTYCVGCGRIEASVTPNSILRAPHQKPFPDDEGKQMCEGFLTRNLVLGTDFITDIALFSIRLEEPLNLHPRYSSTSIALRTVSEALAKVACQLLEIEPGELMAEYRPALTPNGKKGLEAEIFLYDTLPGGAGFASSLTYRGLELFQCAYDLLKNCPERCDASCYRCLRSFKNKFEHALLDRHVGTQLLKYVLTGQVPSINESRLRSSYELLFNDLERNNNRNIVFHKNKQIHYDTGKVANIPILAEFQGSKFIVFLSDSLTANQRVDSQIEELCSSDTNYKIVMAEELVVLRNLPTATDNVYKQITEQAV